MVWSSDASVESEQLRPCWNYLLVWACGHLQRQLTDGQMDISLSLPAPSPSEHRFLLLYVSFIRMFAIHLRRAHFCWAVTLSHFSWDESSSISSGLSDGSDNLSSEEFNTSPTLNSLPTTPIGSRRNSAIVVRSTHQRSHRHTHNTIDGLAVWVGNSSIDQAVIPAR